MNQLALLWHADKHTYDAQMAQIATEVFQALQDTRGHYSSEN